MLYKLINCNYIFQSVSSVALFIILSISPIYATSTYAQSTSLKLEFSKASINEVFRTIEEKSEFVFFYADEIKSELKQNITLKVKSGTIDQIMASVLENTNLAYKLNDRQVIITRKAEVLQDKPQKGIAVNGTVLDQANEPLIGVNIRVKGTQTGAVTDINGNYFITVPNENAVLEFQYIGYEPQEIRVGKRININISMQEVLTDLTEVVVVAYGTQKKASVIGSIATIDPGRLQQSPTRALSNNLAGQLAGVIAVQRSGEPGRDGSTFWIRGISSFQDAGRSPLILVDGIERTLDDMDPAEIESFSVLKDASASAVYGVRGANGVILVNTKRGVIGKPSVSVHLEQSFTQPVKLPNYIGSADYLSLLNELRTDAGMAPTYSEETIWNYRNNTDPDLYPNVDWVDAVTKDHASSTRANLTVNGGSEILRYSLVGSYYGESGIFTRDKSQTWDSSTKLNKFNLRSNVDVNLTKTTIVRINIGGYLQETNGMVDPDTNNGESAGDDILKRAFETTPFIHPAKYSSGEFPRMQSRDNPWALATQHGYTTYSSSKIESLFSLEQDLKFLLPGLKIKGLFSFDRWSNSGVKRHKSPDYYGPATSRNDEGELNIVVNSDGQEFLNTEQLKEWGNKATYLEGSLTYSQTFGGKHHVDGLFLYNQRDYQDGAAVSYRRMGIAGRASYTYDSRYIAEFNFGYNGSENFAKGYRFGFFPSAAVGYLMSEEPFMEPYRKVFSKIKFKGSWGLAGNDQLKGRRFAYITTIGHNDRGGYKWGVNNDYSRDGRFEGDFGIPNLTWETVEKINIGFELGLWNALELQVDLFKEHRYDIFMERNTIPTAAGFIKTPWSNFGKVDNKGVEVFLGFNKKVNKDWFVGFRGTFTYAANKIIEQDEAPGVLGTNRSRTGLPVNQLFGLVAERLFTEDDFEDVATGKLKEGIPSQTFDDKVRPGDIKYKDVDDDGAITTKDETAIGGTYDPQIVYGLGANVAYKNFDLNLFFQGNGRTWRFIGGDYFLPGSTMGTMGNILDNYNDRWTSENSNQDVFYPRLSYGTNNNNSRNSTWWLRNMSMLRMKDIEVGYRLPKHIVSKIGLSSLRIYLKGTNLLTFSGFKLWDPEVDTSNGAKYPIMKSLSFGFDVNF